jgi:hypothetical protein
MSSVACVCFVPAVTLTEPFFKVGIGGEPVTLHELPTMFTSADG